MAEQWTIQEVAKAAGTTSRTLRHYDAIGLPSPPAIAANGYRLYDQSALIRLQRILALRDLGLSLPTIRSVLDRDIGEPDALAELEQQLVAESVRLERQIASVRRTLAALTKGESPMTHDMFDGFDTTQYKEEVESRWGKKAWNDSNAWWNAQGKGGQASFMETVADLNRDWQQALAAGTSPESDTAQALAARHVTWLRGIPGTPATNPETFAEYVRNLGEMYVHDPRFAANYGGEGGAALVRDALMIYTDRIL